MVGIRRSWKNFATASLAASMHSSTMRWLSRRSRRAHAGQRARQVAQVDEVVAKGGSVRNVLSVEHILHLVVRAAGDASHHRGVLLERAHPRSAVEDHIRH